jgi:hypothetical protein
MLQKVYELLKPEMTDCNPPKEKISRGLPPDSMQLFDKAS